MAAVLESTARALLRRVAIEQAEARMPSLAAMVIRDGRQVWFGARGTVEGAAPTTATQYRIGSITKTLVAVQVMRLRDEGLVDLNDPLSKHVPATPVGDVTIAQLLSHTAGLTAEPPGPWWERTPGVEIDALAATLDSHSARHRPGRRFHYSNLGFALLGELIARHRGVGWAEAVRSEILEPLGMGGTTTRPREPHARGYAVHPWADVLLPEPEHDAVAMAPAGQLWSTPADLARWAAFLSAGEEKVLCAATLAEMREPAIVEDGDMWNVGHGLGVQLFRHRGRRLTGHGGSMPGFLAVVWADPADRVGVLCMANATSGLRASIATDLLDILDTHEPPIPREWAPTPADAGMLELTGPWYWGPTAYLLRLLPGRDVSLTPTGSPGRASRFTAQADGTWLGLDGYYTGETLRLMRRADGSISHLDLNTFVFTREPYDPAAPVPGGVEESGWR
jgi:CubicO group peptidase (beta-lactamase class C family)